MGWSSFETIGSSWLGSVESSSGGGEISSWAGVVSRRVCDHEKGQCLALCSEDLHKLHLMAAGQVVA